MELIYRDNSGKIYRQPFMEVAQVGTLIDPDNGDDLELIGWELT